MTRLDAIRTFFQRADNISPNGGRPVTNAELTAYGRANPRGTELTLSVLAEKCAEALGEKLDQV